MIRTMRDRSRAALGASLLSALLCTPAASQQPADEADGTSPAAPAVGEPRPEDVASLDAILGAFYDVISGPAGEPRQWERDRALYIPDARFVAIGTEDGDARPRVMDHETFVRRVDDYMVREGFFEREIHRVVRSFGNLAHVFSTYEMRNAEEGPVIGRGVNSLQLFHDGERWWIAGVVWQDEGAALPIPPELLPG